MDGKIALDDGALRRLWGGVRHRADANAKEVWDSFNERAMTVYRNRKLENPTGLMLCTIRDWFPARHVLERHIALKRAYREAVDIRRQLSEALTDFNNEASLGVITKVTGHQRV